MAFIMAFCLRRCAVAECAQISRDDVVVGGSKIINKKAPPPPPLRPLPYLETNVSFARLNLPLFFLSRTFILAGKQEIDLLSSGGIFRQFRKRKPNIIAFFSRRRSDIQH